MGKYFGTDGFRGEANVNLTVEHAFKVGRFLGWYYGQKKPDERCRIVIGKDTRRSSYMFEYSLVAGLTASGADVFLLHVTTTPSVSYVVRTEGFNCGIMISASHNPYYDNGIKVINEKGEKLEESVIVEIEKYLDGEMGEIPLAKKDKIGRTVDFAAGRNRYIGYLISIATRSFKNMKVALDCANGSSSAIAKNVFDALGAETHVISNEPNGLNINTDCGSTHIEHLQKFVVEEGCDVGFAYDGDADRCIAVDEKGNVVDGDGIMYVCGKYMKEQGSLFQTYNIGGHNEKQNIEIIHIIIETLQEMLPDSDPRKAHINNDLITYVEDRKGHDRRYAIAPDKIKAEIGWYPETMFKEGIRKTIAWYFEHEDWMNNVTSGDYQKYYNEMYEEK